MSAWRTNRASTRQRNPALALALAIAAAAAWLPVTTWAMPPLEDGLLWTAPLQPVAGAPVQVLFHEGLIQGYQAEFTGAMLEDSRIVLDYVLTGEVIGSDIVLDPVVFAARLAPLPAGTYIVVQRKRYPDGEQIDEELGTLTVTEGEPPTPARPAGGYWSAPMEPGSGLYLEHKGDVLAVALYTFRHTSPTISQWWLGNAAVLADSVPIAMQQFGDGPCLGCAGEAPRASNPALAVRMRFESARRAWVDINGSATLPMTSLPYGAAYVPVALADPLDSDFGTLPLPDLRGEWVFAVEDDFFAIPIKLDFDELIVAEGNAEFRQGEDARIRCVGADGSRSAGCEYQWTGFVFGTAPPGTFPYTVWFNLGDIEEDRMHGVASWLGLQLRVRAFRIDERDTSASAPAGG